MEQSDFRQFQLQFSVNHSKSKIRNSYGVRDAYLWYMHNKPAGKKYVLDCVQYHTIIRELNKVLANWLINGEIVHLPERLGSLQIKQYDSLELPKQKNGRPYRLVDWGATLRLWYKDENAFRERFLVKRGQRPEYNYCYRTLVKGYKNQQYYCFQVARSVKERFKQKVAAGEVYITSGKDYIKRL